jgi:hypothetical protein
MADRVALFLLVVAIVEVGALTYAYRCLGTDRRWAYTLLCGSVVGASINIPVARFSGHTEVTATVVRFMDVRSRCLRWCAPARPCWRSASGAVIPPPSPATSSPMTTSVLGSPEQFRDQACASW